MTPSGAAATGVAFGAGWQASELPLTAQGGRASYASPWAVVGVRVGSASSSGFAPPLAPTMRPSLHTPSSITSMCRTA